VVLPFTNMGSDPEQENGNGRRLLGALTAFLAAGMILPSVLVDRL